MRSLALFFSHGTSLATWREGGLLSRENAYYLALSETFGSVTYVTYDRPSAALAADVERVKPADVLCNRWRLPYRIFGLVAPLLYRRRLRACSVLKTNQLSGAWTAVIAKWVTGRPLVVRCGYVASRAPMQRVRAAVVKRLERLVLRSADLVFVATPSDQQYLVETHHVDAAKFRIVPTPIDVQHFAPPRVRAAEGNRVAYVGRLSPEKGVDLLVDAVSRIDDVRLDVYGTGPLEASLRERADPRRIVFHGAVANTELPERLHEASIFVLASQFEGSPKALLEAMACGMAVIGVNVRGIRDVIVDGENGLLVARDAKSIAAAIERLRDDPALAQRLGEAARAFVVRNYSQADVARREAGYLESLRP